jgi:hypothetical protein
LVVAEATQVAQVHLVLSSTVITGLESPVKGNDDYSDNQRSEQDKESELPKVAETVSTWSVNHQAYTIGERN